MRINAALFSISLLLGASWSEARPMDLSGVPQVLREKWVSETPDLETRSWSLSEADEKIKVWQADPAIERVLLLESGEQLKVQVITAQRIGEIKIRGQRQLSASNVRSALDLASGDRFSVDILTEAAERLRQAYLKRGLRNPVIDVETPESDTGLVDLQFEIKEGSVTQVSEWRIRSRNTKLATELETLLNRRQRGAYTEDRLLAAQDLIRRELRAGRHFHAEVLGPQVQFSADETSAVVTFRINRPESFSVDFRGNRELSTRLLETSILDLKNFVTSNPNVGAELSEKLRQAYLIRGYARVQITSEELEGAEPSQKRLIFTIDEGPRVRIENYEIKGRISREPRYYIDLIRENSSKLISQGYFYKADLDVGLENLVLQLQNEGYLVAKVTSFRTEYNRDRTALTLHIHLDEGPLTIVESIEFQGNNTLSETELKAALTLRENSPLLLPQIDEAVRAVQNEYWNRGYIEMRLLNQGPDLVVYNEDNTRARLVFEIEEGPRVRVANIMLDGNSFTRDFVLMNELDFEVGEYLTPAKINESVARLQKTGYFGSVEIRTLEERTPVSDRTVVVRVTERNPGVFTIGAGATNENEFTLRGYTGIAYRNLLGTGRGVSLRVEANYNVARLRYPENRIILGYVEPYLANTRNRGRVNISRSNVVVDYELEKVQELIHIAYSVERDFTSNITGIWDLWSLGSYRDFYLSDQLPERREEIASTIGRLDFDYRNNPFNPTAGHLTKFSTEYSSPALRSQNVDEFWRTTGSFTHYWDIRNSGWVWVNSVRGGYLESLGQGVDGGVPYDKVGFILGGRSTLRGFEAGTSDVFPNNSDLGVIDAYKLTTTATMSLIKSEIRFPLWMENLGASLFYDGGSVVIEGLQMPDTYRDSAGFGFYYVTPVGPLNVEFAWKLDQRDGESPWRFHLSIGSF